MQTLLSVLVLRELLIMVLMLNVLNVQSNVKHVLLDLMLVLPAKEIESLMNVFVLVANLMMEQQNSVKIVIPDVTSA
jgi:hypothetical protein